MSKEAKEEIARLKSVRGAFKGHCTRDIELAERLLSAGEQADESELKALSGRLDRRMRDIAEKDSIIIIIITLLTCQVCLAEGKSSTNRGHLIDN